MSDLPVSARLAWWGTSWLRGLVSPDDLLDAVLDDSPTHVMAGAGLEQASLLGGLAELRVRGATAIGAAFPADGDPVGLGGPREFNSTAIEAGEAVVVLGTEVGLVPFAVGPVVEWHAYPAQRRQLPDVVEADHNLRTVLLQAAERLAALDVAHWRPEVADELMNLRHAPRVSAPAGVPDRCVQLAARGLQARGIADLALEDDGAAISAMQAELRRTALLPLSRAARAALVAACSPEVWPPS